MIQFKKLSPHLSTHPKALSPGELASTPCYRNLNLLAHAQLEELDIGSLCGGHGICGGDRIQILAEPNDLSPITEKERDHLSQEELNAGWRLGCQCWPQKDELKISVLVPSN